MSFNRMTKRDQDRIRYIHNTLSRGVAYLYSQDVLVGRALRPDQCTTTDVYTRAAVPALQQEAGGVAVFEKDYGTELCLLRLALRDLERFMRTPVVEGEAA